MAYGDTSFLTRPMPPLPAAVIAAVKAAPAIPHGNGGMVQRGIYTADGLSFIQQAPWPMASRIYGVSPDSDYAVTDASLIDWNTVPIQQLDINGTNYGAVYDPVSGAWDSYFVGTDDNSWRDVIIAVAIVVGGYYGGTYLSETFGTVGADAVGVGGGSAGGGGAGGFGGEAFSGMDLAADAGMGSVNSGGGASWGGGSMFNTGSFDTGYNPGDVLDSYDGFDWGSDTWSNNWSDTGSWGGSVDTGYIPSAPDYPIPDINIAPANGGTSWTTWVKDATGATREVLGAVLSVAQTVKAFQGQIEPAGPARIANPSTGLVNGQRPPTGVMQLAPDGSAIINNGDGTYTVIRPDGSRYTGRYNSPSLLGGGLGGLNTNTLLLGALGLGAVMLLSKR